MGRTHLHQDAVDPGPIASRGVFVPVFLKELIASCDFPGRVVGVKTPCPILDLSMIRYTCVFLLFILTLYICYLYLYGFILRTSIKCLFCSDYVVLIDTLCFDEC